ncbi:MAG: TatD family hydrolase [Saprospiraceae bacterium]
MLIDTHAHVYTDAFTEDLEKILEKAYEDGIEQIYMPNIDSAYITVLHEVEKKYPFCKAMMGLHPCSVGANYKEELAVVKQWINQRDYIAMGEIGIDLYWDKTFVVEQEVAFRQQLDWAKEKGWPVAIHSRDSLDLTISIVSEYAGDGFKGVFHCFNGDEDQAKKIMELQFYLGIGGVLTYKNAGLDKVVENLSLDYLVLETDSPYLPPVPYRGKRNEPAYLIDIAKKLADIKNISLEEIGATTTKNAKNLFSHTP